MIALFFIISVIVSVLFTWLIRKVAQGFSIVDRPDGERKLHSHPTPLLGGVAIFISFWLLVGYLAIFQPLYGLELLRGKLFAAFLASTVLLLVGVADEIRPFSAWARLALTAGAVAIAVIFGIHLEKITHPLGGAVELGLVAGSVLVFFWLMGITYTVKILDGLDGLASGVVAIGSLMIFLLTNTQFFYQPNVGLLAIIFAGVCFGFLFFNFCPATIFLGESGGLVAGFLLATLAVISGGKVATALLVMAVPILDLARVIYWRIRHGQPVFKGDREHLHYQLIDRGFSERAVALLFYAVSIVFGGLALILQSREKVLVFLLVLIAMVAGVRKLKP